VCTQLHISILIQIVSLSTAVGSQHCCLQVTTYFRLEGEKAGDSVFLMLLWYTPSGADTMLSGGPWPVSCTGSKQKRAVFVGSHKSAMKGNMNRGLDAANTIPGEHARWTPDEHQTSPQGIRHPHNEHMPSLLW